MTNPTDSASQTLLSKDRALRLTLRATGVMFIVFFTIALIVSSTKSDTPDLLYRMTGWGSLGDAEEQMLSVIYIVWGAFLWRAASNPGQHGLFIDYTLVANAAHFGLMGVQAVVMDGEHTHLYGDVLLGSVILVILAAAWLPARRGQVQQRNDSYIAGHR